MAVPDGESLPMALVRLAIKLKQLSFDPKVQGRTEQIDVFNEQLEYTVKLDEVGR